MDSPPPSSGPLSRVILCRPQGEHRPGDECLAFHRGLDLDVAKDQVREFWKLPPIKATRPGQAPRVEPAPIQLLYVEGDTVVRLTQHVWTVLRVDPDFRLVYWRDDPPEPTDAPKPARAV
ncbi:hypothetical protein FRC19_008731 [Serendipita sp. 401]|nr:hypothetical protein FRC19_008731 [Serendipita sp. 401]